MLTKNWASPSDTQGSLIFSISTKYRAVLLHRSFCLFFIVFFHGFVYCCSSCMAGFSRFACLGHGCTDTTKNSGYTGFFLHCAAAISRAFRRLQTLRSRCFWFSGSILGLYCCR